MLPRRNPSVAHSKTPPLHHSLPLAFHMRLPLLILSLLVTVAFSLTSFLDPCFQTWAGNRSQSTDLLTVALGDSRRLFARHFYVKADAYFHSGYYPTIYDTHTPSEGTHMAAPSQEAVGPGAS